MLSMHKTSDLQSPTASQPAAKKERISYFCLGTKSACIARDSAPASSRLHTHYARGVSENVSWSVSLIPLIDSELTSVKVKGLKGLDLQGGSIIDRSRSAGLSDPSMIWVPVMLGEKT
jgi:hypothetical protein